jgi:integrase
MDVDLVGSNPAARLRKRGVERVKTRTLTDDEIRLFWAHTKASIPYPIGLALRLVLVTGVRPGEAAGMARSELEFDASEIPVVWTISASRSKNARAHFVPLSPLARAIVGEALDIAGTDAPFVFTSRAACGHLDTSTLATAMARLSKILPDNERGTTSWKAEPPTAHDLRRTCATRLAAAGVPSEDIAAVLNHLRADVTGRHYDQYRRADEKRRALDRWARILAVIVKPSSATNVIPLR